MNAPLILSTLLAFGGMLALFLGLERHFKQLFTRKPHWHRLRALRLVGWLALVFSFYTSAMAWGWAMGAVGWVGLLSLAGISVALTAPYLTMCRDITDAVPPKPSRRDGRPHPNGR